jgi:hypothetical protein
MSSKLNPKQVEWSRQLAERFIRSNWAVNRETCDRLVKMVEPKR